MLTRDVFEKLSAVYSVGNFSDDYQRARETYFTQVGKLFEDDPFFESRINAFLEWYIIDRLYEPLGVPFVRRHRLMYGHQLSHDEQEAMLALELSRRSVFDVKSIGSSQVKLYDLLSQRIIELSKQAEYVSLEEGDLIEGRIVHFKGQSALTGSFWHHPKDATVWLRRGLITQNTNSSQSTELMFKVSAMRWKRERFPHVPIETIYDFGATTKGRGHAQA